MADYEYQESYGDETSSEYKGLDILSLIDKINIINKLTPEVRQKIESECCLGYEIDKQSRKHREDAMEKAMNMAMHITQEKNFPWPKASNVIFPLISEACISFAARAYPAIVRNGKIAKGKVVGDDKGVETVVTDPMGNPMIDPETGQPATVMVGEGAKKERAKKNADYLNYQLTEEMEEWDEETDRLLSALPVVGNMFRKVYYNSDLERLESSIIYPAHLIVNYKTKSLKKALRISEEMELYPHQIIERIRDGRFSDFDFGASSQRDEDIGDNDKGSSAGTSQDKNAPHLFIEQHTRYDLDDDGYPEPYIITFHKQSGVVVRIVANFQEDKIEYNESGEIKRIKPEAYYVKYGLIPAPDGGFYDQGLGELLLHLNESINGTINRLMDAGTLANTSSGFIGRGLKVKGGSVRQKMGEYKIVDNRGMSLRENIYQMQHQQPSPVLFQLLGLLIEAGKNLGGLKDVLAGEQVSNQAGITAMALIEQGLTSFKSIYKRIRRSIKDELKIMYRLNSLYLEDEHYYTVMDNQQTSAREDFNTKGVDVAPATDLSQVSEMQRMAKISFLQDYVNDPLVNPLEIRKRIFEGADIEDYDELIVKEMPQAPEDPMMAIAKVESENNRLKFQLDAMKEKVRQEQERDKLALDEDKQDLEWYKAQLQGRSGFYDSILKVAQAEAQEEGTQINKYKAVVDADSRRTERVEATSRDQTDTEIL